MMRYSLLGPICLIGVITACGDVAERPLPELSFEAFVEDVQPVLASRCGNPTTCHGSEQRPFAIYSPRANRADPADVFRDPPLTEAELKANFRRTQPFAREIGRSSLLLSKPLAFGVSGVDHEGGAQFASTADREYRVIEEWLQ